MEKGRIDQLTQELLKEGHIQSSVFEQFQQDLANTERSKNVLDIFQQVSLKQMLKIYLRHAYHSESDPFEGDNKSSTLTYNDLKKRKSERCGSRLPSIDKPRSQNLQDLTQSVEKIKNLYRTCTKFLSEMICNRKEKVIQNYFVKLFELLLGTPQYAYARWENKTFDKERPKIEYFNSQLNYLTVFLLGEVQFKDVIDLHNKLRKGAFRLTTANSQFANVFNIKNSQNRYICQAIQTSEESIIFVKKETDTKLYNYLQHDPHLASLYELLCIQAAETLHVSKFEVLNTQFTLKSILSLLEFSIKLEARILQFDLEDRYAKTHKFTSLSQLIEQLNKGSEDDQFVKLIYEDFCSRVYDYETQINKFKIQIMDVSSVYLNFNSAGQLRFVSNKLPSFIFKKLAQKGNTDGITVFDFFGENNTLISKIQQAVQGTLKEETWNFVEKDRKVQVSFGLDEESELRSLTCVLNAKAPRRSLPQGSQTSFKAISTGSIHSTDSESDIRTQIREGTGINKNAQKMLVELEQQRPGVSKTGWLEAFMKNDVLEKYTKKWRNQEQKEELEVIKENPRKRMSISLMYEPSSDVVKILQQIDSYDLNLLEVEQEHLFPLAKTILSRLKFSIESDFNVDLLDNFLRQLATKYGKHNNPFHNFTHGVNVMHMCYLLSKLQKNKDYLSDVNAFALVFSGLCHDVGHPGRTNLFEINSGSKKAIRYNDRSPLENYHASTSYFILQKPENNFLATIKKDQYTQIRKEFISNILATDIKEHFPLVNNYETKLKSSKGFEKIPADVQLTTNFLIHTSDFAGACKPFHISRKWAELVNQEFSSQYVQEGQLGIAQTPYMKNLDREEVMAQNEAGFVKVIVRPLFKGIADRYETEQQIRKLLKNVDDNMLMWEKIVSDFKAKEK